MAMARPGNVLAAFDQERRCQHQQQQLHKPQSQEGHEAEQRRFCDEQDQHVFATLLQKHWYPLPTNSLQSKTSSAVHSPGPTKRYLYHLLKRFVATRVKDEAIESERLVELLLETTTPIGSRVLHGAPNPDESCHLCFRRICGKAQSRLKIRIFPYHNDVALRIWEAGALLAEYLIANPSHIQNKRCFELGAGTAVTGLAIIAAGASEVVCSDYTPKSLVNMNYNIAINQEWLSQVRATISSYHCHDNLSNKIQSPVSPSTVLGGYLDWNKYGKHKEVDDANVEINDPQENAINSLVSERATTKFASSTDALSSQYLLSEVKALQALDGADVLLAADVIYDPTVIPTLARSVSRFLDSRCSSGNNASKCAIFATTLRNRDTFALFEAELARHDILVHYIFSSSPITGAGASVSATTISTSSKLPPVLFPMNFTQHRQDVRIAVLTKK